METKFKYLLLDWDGCLADTLSVWMAGYKSVFQEHGLNPSEEEIVKVVFGDYQGPIKVGLEEHKLHDFFTSLNNRIREGLISVKLHPGVFETLDTLYNKGIKMTLVTSSKRNSVEPALLNNQIEKYFEFILDADDVTKHKPDPEIIIKAMQKFSAKPEESLVVGDSNKDILAGQAAGTSTAVFFPKINQSFYQRQELESYHPNFLFEDFTDLVKIVI